MEWLFRFPGRHILAGLVLAFGLSMGALAVDPPAPPKPTLDSLAKELADLKKTHDEANTKHADNSTVAHNKGDSAWMLTSAAMVNIMLPGLALFYGGMVRRKNVLATMMQSMAALSVVGMFWVSFGYSMAFGPSVSWISLPGFEGGVVGWSWDLFFLQGIKSDQALPASNISIYAHMIFQGMFAIITPALISGALAERIRFWPFCLFCILWVTLVYCPLAHMVWAFDWFYAIPVDLDKGLGGSAIGILGKMGALDFAGGTVVHIAAGAAALACILVLRPRQGYPQQPIHPNSMVLTLVGAGLLWFGWFGFNGGSATASGTLATSAFVATQVAAAAAGLSWIVTEWLLRGKPTALGLASGIVAGLVAVTPASGFVNVGGAAAIGILAGVVCYYAVSLKSVFGYDDSLDAFGVHGVGGFLGAVLTGVFCFTSVNSLGADGFFAVKFRSDRITTVLAEIGPAVTGASDSDKVASLDKLIETRQATVDAASATLDEAKGKLDEEAKKDKPEALDGLKKAREMAFMAKYEADGKLGKVTELKALLEARIKFVKEEKTPLTQLVIQTKAALFALVFAFVISFGLAHVVQAITLGNFTTDKESEVVGLDETEHGETGFDFGPSLNTVVGASQATPKAANFPPNRKPKHFTLTVKGPDEKVLHETWSKLCQGNSDSNPDMKKVYPFITTLTGNSFRFRDGDPNQMKDSLERALKTDLNGSLTKVFIEA